VRRLPAGSRPLDGSAATWPTHVAPVRDADGVPMSVVQGRRVYKPAGLAQTAIRFVNGFQRTGDAAYLAYPEAIGRALVRTGHMSKGALFLPYAFDFAMHSNPKDIIRAPWYSAMAQGLALSLFSRLHAATGDPAYLSTARRLYRSLQPMSRGPSPWVAWVDGSGYLWLEEYAQPHPDHALNGFIFAAFGLYDYWLESGDPGALQEFRGALTTLQAHLMEARNAGRPMDYCLVHGQPQLKYHRVVVAQLRQLARITGSPFFIRAVAVFARDA